MFALTNLMCRIFVLRPLPASAHSICSARGMAKAVGHAAKKKPGAGRSRRGFSLLDLRAMVG
jgi:hypothetical protein